jgi:hypothetical protein
MSRSGWFEEAPIPTTVLAFDDDEEEDEDEEGDDLGDWGDEDDDWDEDDWDEDEEEGEEDEDEDEDWEEWDENDEDEDDPFGRKRPQGSDRACQTVDSIRRPGSTRSGAAPFSEEGSGREPGRP